MKKLLSDTDIVANYEPVISATADDGDEAKCRRCGRNATTGDRVHAWRRYSKQAVHLPRGIELCHVCDHQVRQLQSNLPE